ncbi:Leucine-rich repeat-containing protein 56, partial [Galemys pyrenaicus]
CRPGPHATPLPGCLTHGGKKQLPPGEGLEHRVEAHGPSPGQSCGSRPGTASVQVRELSWQGLHNPRPQSKAPGGPGHGHGEQLVEEYLSPARLQALAQVGDLRRVTVLELCVDTREHSLGSFGVHLPKLRQLKLNGSCLGSVRDLGTSLGHLQVLWLARCGLADLDGIGSFPALRELYASYNDVSDLSPLCLLDQLEVLDLEGNGVDDLGQVRYLQLCPRLAMLTLEGNLVCLQPGPSPPNKVTPGYNYRAEVRRLVPQLRVLDEAPATHTSLPVSPKLDPDWLMVKEAIKGGGALEGRRPEPGRATSPAAPPIPGPAHLPTCPAQHPAQAAAVPWPRDRPPGACARSLRPEPPLPETQPQAPGLWPFSLLSPGGPLPEGPLPAGLGSAVEDDTSTLTHGACRALCGNPTKGLRERRRSCQAWAPPEQPPHQPEDLAAWATTPAPDPADSQGLLALAGLRVPQELRLRSLGSQQEGAATPQGPLRSLEGQEGQAGPGSSPRHPAPTPEPPRTPGHTPSPYPARLPMPPDPGSGPRGAAELQLRGRRLRALGSRGPGLGLAAVTALRALDEAAGPHPRAAGHPSPKPAPASGTCHT